jgi:hypothetical protein
MSMPGYLHRTIADRNNSTLKQRQKGKQQTANERGKSGRHSYVTRIPPDLTYTHYYVKGARERCNTVQK